MIDHFHFPIPKLAFVPNLRICGYLVGVLSHWVIFEHG